MLSAQDPCRTNAIDDFIHHGYRATGIALSLGKRRNTTDDGGIGPEYINVDDLAQAVELVVEASRSVGSRQLSLLAENGSLSRRPPAPPFSMMTYH